MISVAGDTIIPFEYEEIRPRERDEKYFAAKKDGRWGVIDTLGRTIIPFKYLSCPGFRAQYIAVSHDGKVKGAIDYKGREIIPIRYDYINSGDNGIIYARESKSDRKGLFHVFNLAGREILPRMYEEVKNFTENMIPVKLNGKWGVVDTLNNVVLPFEYDDMSKIRNGFLVAYKRYEESHDGSAPIRKWRAWAYDSNARRVTKNAYNSIQAPEWHIADSILIVGSEEKYGMIKADGNNTQLIPCEYKQIIIWPNKMGQVMNFNDKFAVIKEDGTFLTPFIYDDVSYRWPNTGDKEWLSVGTSNYNLFGVRQWKHEKIDMHGNVSKSDYNFDNITKKIPVPGNTGAYIVGVPENKKTYGGIIVSYTIIVDGNAHEGWIYGVKDSKGKEIIPVVCEVIETEVVYPYPRSTGFDAPQTVRTLLPPNHIAILRDGLWGIMDVSTQQYIINGWDKINGVYGDRYIVGTTRRADTKLSAENLQCQITGRR